MPDDTDPVDLPVDTPPPQVNETAEVEAGVDDADLEDLIPDEAIVQEAQAAATALLAIVNVTRVICVDDDFNGTVEDLKTTCTALQDSDNVVSCLNDVTFDVPPEIWRPVIDARWAAMSDTERGVAIADAKEKAGELDTDQLNAGALWAVLSADEVEFIALTPTDWIANENYYLAEAAETPTLVLFDKDLQDGHDGVQLAISLYAKDTDNVIWAGLFTHTTDIANEHTVWKTHSDNPGIQEDRFIVLSKQHMGPEPGTFPQALKVALMTRPASLFRRAVSKAIGEQVVAAQELLDGLSPTEFERLVFGLTREEGQWEVDMLLRLFDAHLRSEVRQKVHADDGVRNAILMLRNLNEAATLPTADTTHAQAIYRRELYEEGTYLKSVHLPLELGDIFTTANGKNYILVLQPCDLMVRSGGVRQPDLQHAGLVEIFDKDPNAPKQSEEGGEPPSAVERREPIPTFELPAFKDGDSAWAHLGRAYMVPIEALDFCVFHPEGRSIAPAVGAAPEWVLPGWAKRYEKLANSAAAISGVLNPLMQNNTVSPDNRKRIAASYYGRVRGVAKLSLTEDNVVQFDLQRTARLRSPYATALLTRFTTHIARDAFDRPMI